jgi:hypothetical protein
MKNSPCCIGHGLFFIEYSDEFGLVDFGLGKMNLSIQLRFSLSCK